MGRIELPSDHGLAAILVARLFWRGTRGRRLAPAITGLQHWAATAVHFAIYGLLLAQATLGFLFRWAQGEPFLFFGLFSIPSPFVFEPGSRRVVHEPGQRKHNCR